MVDSPNVKLNNICLVRQNKRIISDISWTINPSENWVLLGKNGIGKSTLINIICTRCFPTQGDAYIFGKKMGDVDLTALRPSIGVLTADIANSIPNNSTALEVVVSAKHEMLSLWGDSRDQKLYSHEDFDRAFLLLEEFRISHISNREWGKLSQGEKKRILIARTLFNNPDLLIYDEPTAGLDLGAREFVINMLTQLSAADKSNKRSIILVNHNVEEIPPSFEHTAIMGNSKSKSDNKDFYKSTSGTIIYQGLTKNILNSDNLSNAYGINISVVKMPNLRYFASSSVVIENGN